MIATGSSDSNIRLWDIESGRLVRALEGHQNSVWSVAWSGDGQWLASGAEDGTVRVWEASRGRLVHTLEGHQDWVWSVAWSGDGQWLASGASDRTVRVWGVESGTELAVDQYRYSAYNLLDIFFVRDTPVIAVFGKTRLGDDDMLVETPGLELHTPTSTLSPTSYVSAKIVLVGQSNVGKSCLALRLAQDRYEEQGTTHGMRLWTMPPEQLSPDMAAPPGEKREVVIWDLGGQDEYRLVHQLFLHDTTLALILLDPTRGSSAFEDVKEWNLRLEQQLRGRAAIKLLIGAKLDTNQALIDTVGLEQLVKECTCHGYFPTSAKVPRGIDTLRAAIAQAIDWSELSKTTRPRLFQRIREGINERQQRGDIVLFYSELERQIHEAEPDEFDPGAVNTVVEQLRGQGVLAEAHLTTGQRVLVLQLSYVEQYAGALIIVAAKNASRGIPVLEERAIAQGTVSLPGIKPDERLNAIQERIVLDCVVQLLVDHGIALRHAGQLIFPALFPLTTAADDANIAQTVSLYYDFSGAIDNLYSSLVVSLALSERFGRARLWKDRAQYEQPGTGVCGVHKIDRHSGLAHLDLFFSEETTDETRQLFTVFVEEHLRHEGVEIKEVLGMVCGSCNYSFTEADVKSRIDQGHADIGCPRCDARWRISEGARQARASNPSAERELVAIKTRIEDRKREDIHDIRAAFKPIKCFLSYAHSDEPLREELMKHLSLLQRQSVIQTWHDRNINAGDDWKQQIDDNLNTATVILLLISADFLASDYCYEIEMQRALARHNAGEARVIPVIVRPVDWHGAPFGILQALPANATPITSWANRDEAFRDVAQGVRRAVEAMLRPALTVETAADTGASESVVASHVQAAPIRILHLSDLHFDKDDDPLARLQPLLRDIRDRDGGLGFEHLDYLVLSGDLTNHGSAEEFDGVYRFVSELIKRFELSAGRCVIVPGNHDLSWEMEVYDWQPKRKVALNKLKPGSYVAQGDGYLIRDDGAYLRRFENFGRFYHELIQLPYPLQPATQCIPILFDDTRLQFLALNSAWEIDEYHRERASINQSALAAGLLEAAEQITRARRDGRMAQDAEVLRIAVWHHPVTGNEKISDDAFLEQLRQERVKLCLHGHVHEDRADVIGYLHPRRAVHIAGAGSFGAPVNARPESTPRLYNLLEVWRDHSKIRVRTRCLRRDGGAWEGWAVWPGAQADERRTYYDIQLKG
jgi:GTPase SAR1 family protein/predicted phosphodiesterase